MDFNRATQDRARRIFDAQRRAEDFRNLLQIAAAQYLENVFPGLTAYATSQQMKAQEEALSIIAEAEREHPRSVAGADALTQTAVAEDFGTTRQTIARWEDRQTEAGPGNKSNPYGYYRELRTNPALRGAYNLLAASAKAYRQARNEFLRKNPGKRFVVRFVRFNEEFMKLNVER